MQIYLSTTFIEDTTYNALEHPWDMPSQTVLQHTSNSVHCNTKGSQIKIQVLNTNTKARRPKKKKKKKKKQRTKH